MITYKDLNRIRKENLDKTITFCSGSFDIFHAGHVLFFEDCKKFGDILVVGVGHDSTLKNKGSDRPIINHHMRVKVIDSLKAVDYAFIHHPPKPGSNYHNIFIEEIFKKLKPDVWVVNTDASEIEFRRKLAKKYGTKLVILDRKCPRRFKNISTTGIIKKIRESKL